MSWWKRLVTFLSEVRSEMKKVTYPSRDEVVATTVVVLITSFVFALYLYLADVVISGAWTYLLKVLG